MSPDSGWSARTATHSYARARATARAHPRPLTLSLLLLCHLHEIAEKGACYHCVVEKNRTNWEDNGRQKTREREREEGKEKALHDTVFIKDSCSQSKGQERFIGFNFPTRSINIYDLSVPASAMIIFKTNGKRGALFPLSMAVHSFVVKLNQQEEENTNGVSGLHNHLKISFVWRTTHVGTVTSTLCL